ncbi:hypothetical protein F4555_000361 [Mobiluncus mulieris]|uniref:Uncharacterized protein n=2 Tax=Mobiluncus mulieris TaxID=2052 RepID=A0A8G2HSW9_9ACTO|nr:hypothetical protein [Mobiluncus mulieris]EEJ53683.1 hypothetical protein HMPREF0577_1389 [Mobiluncus mulieris ATCC 35243]MBB5845565.1 hypothetical protein [Mobiluncus mulieris]MCU9971363.1 hypothetical protein [Mobiluncus mulieris]MCV0002710.1 hypothetical protein [Mobiluncus mulieris]MCV0011920.1 hypothetical protein [Mobiluncus mulieris]
MAMQRNWDDWEESDFDSPWGDDSLGGRLTCFIINQVPESRFSVLFDYTYSEWDNILVFKLMGDIFDFKVMLTPQFIAEIRQFTTDEPGDYAQATLDLLDEYLETHAQPFAKSVPKTAVPA